MRIRTATSRDATQLMTSLVFLLSMRLLVFGQAGNEVPEVRALWIPEQEAPRLDGRLDEPVWDRAPLASDFLQREPREGEPATESTEVRILYSKQALYFGVFCHDSQPESILATELQRDDQMRSDDTFAVSLDTFHDHRNGFMFVTNPLGTKFDAVITDEGQLNVEWDEKWSTATQVSNAGWVVEIAIPWKTLRTQSDKFQTWGIDFERIIRRKAEQTYWAGYSQDYSFRNVSRYGHLEDLEDVRGGLRLRVKPYVATSFTQARADGRLEFNSDLDAGVEDIKLSLTPSITADFTINPDFAQTDVDQSVFNLTRFSLFFPEKRDFFLEQAGTFTFGPESGVSGGAPDMLVFFSRRIGLNEEGAPVPILTGGRLTGDAANFQFGALDVLTRPDGVEPSANFAVFRLKRKLRQRSYVGGIFTNKTVSHTGGLNRVGGVDANLVFFDKLNVFGMLAKSSTQGESVSLNPGLGEHLSYQGSINWRSDLWTVELNRTRIDDNFDPQIGFVRRSGIIKHRAQLRWRPRPQNSSIIRQYWFNTEHEWFTRQEGFQESRKNFFFVGAVFEPREFTGVFVNRNYEFLDEPFEIAPDIVIPAGGYQFEEYGFLFNTHRGRRLSTSFRGSLGEFFDGRMVGATLDPLIKINSHLSLGMGYSVNRVSLPAGNFTAHVTNTQVNYNFSNKLLMSTTLQHNNISGGFLVNWRLNYIYRPGDDLFIVYRESRDFDDPNLTVLGRALLVKFTHSFDF